MPIASLTQAGRRLRREEGITLVELLIAMVMLLVLSGAAMMLLVVAVREQPAISGRDDAIQQARVLQESIIRELRPSYSVTTATPSQITFDTYLRRTACASAATPAADSPAIQCRVTYACTAGTCTRGETDPTGTVTPRVTTVVSGISNSDVFGYAPSATNPSYVTTKLVFPAQNGDDAITLQDGVELRNH